MEFVLDRTFLFHTLQELVRINSVNPCIAPEGRGEREIAQHIAESLRNMGVEINLLESIRGRPSVVGVLPGKGHGKSLMLNAHIDTVGVADMSEPFAATVRNGRLYGRGAYDMKGSVAAMLAAARAILDSDIELQGDLVLAFVADEEYESIGTQEVLRHYKTDAAIVTEPSQLQLCLAHKGFVWFEVETLGRAAHGSRFEEGIDANMRMGRVLHELEKLEKSLRQRKRHPLVGPPSLHAAILRGGTGLSTYAARCELKIERRTVPGETEESVRREIEKILQKLSQQDETFQAKLTTLCVREPFEVDAEAGIVQTLHASATRVLQKPPAMVGDTPWMDAALLAGAGIETVVFGPSGGGAHSAEEWVDIESVEKLAAILVHTAANYCC
ncbi:MAG: ArgE/DapE family deacylase [candidate division KSB1 bacterium]|nr:ArgE/DapE family deacylase [candidate division KSB1 bacterium]